VARARLRRGKSLNNFRNFARNFAQTIGLRYVFGAQEGQLTVTSALTVTLTVLYFG
jgi:hypothetical protein